MDNSSVVGTRLRMFRKNHLKVSIQDVADQLGVTRSIYGRIETGDVKIDINKLHIMHDVYNMNINWVILGKGSPIYEDGSTTTNYADDMQQVNFLGGEQENVQIAKEDIGNFGTKEVESLKKDISHLTTERDLYKKLYEKSEIEIDFYKNQLKK